MMIKVCMVSLGLEASEYDEFVGVGIDVAYSEFLC